MNKEQQSAGAAVPLSDIRGAVARGWCSPKNSHKEMDADLALAIADEVAALIAIPQAQPESAGDSVDAALDDNAWLADACPHGIRYSSPCERCAAMSAQKGGAA